MRGEAVQKQMVAAIVSVVLAASGAGALFLTTPNGGLVGDSSDAAIAPAATTLVAGHGFFWKAEEGKIPAETEASTLPEVGSLRIEGDKDFARQEIVEFVKGAGTIDDPYVIEGLRVLHELSIKDTSAPIIVRNNFIDGQLRMNYNGHHVYVHHNYIRDLRVNENIERIGDQSGGVIENNKIGAIGQIRHFNGEIRYNEIGPRPPGFLEEYLGDPGILRLKEDQAVNFDGWHAAKMHHNKILGYVELQLHGHSHGSCYACEPHNHADARKAREFDHTIRFHSFSFIDNQVTVEKGIAVRYTDGGHAGDDRTANSEPERTLEKYHTHYTKILIARNTLLGGSLVVDIFNAEDELHKDTNPAELSVEGNVVDALEGDRLLWWGWDVRAAIDIRTTRDAKLVVRDNEGRFTEREKSTLDPLAVPVFGEWLEENAPAVIRLEGFESSDLSLQNNRGAASAYGIDASWFDEKTTWKLSGNQFDAPKQVQYDESVENPPQ